MANIYVVKQGDTLTSIAKAYDTDVGTLVKLNDIENPDFIVVGQKIKTDGETTAPATNTTSKASIKAFGLQSNTDRTLYVSWAWDKKDTEKYQVKWYYYTGDKDLWFVGSDSTVTVKQAVYTAPANATGAKVTVKPIAKETGTYTKTTPWTAAWSTVYIYWFKYNPPSTPSVPSVTLDRTSLTAELNNLDVNGTHIEFQVVKDNATVYKTGKAKITTGRASYNCTVALGSEYKVRCRAVNGSKYSGWTAYSDNIKTVPKVPTISDLQAKSETSMQVRWTKTSVATSYDLEYTTKAEYFTLNATNEITAVNGLTTIPCLITGLETGATYFVRMRAVNETGYSLWSGVKSVTLGMKPAAPTTWSSTNTVISGEPLTLYWVHNSQDGSSQTYADLELTVDGQTVSYQIKNTTDEDERDKTSFYVVDTSKYDDGAVIQWRVKTAGITNVFGDYSISRTVDVYAQPTLELSVTNARGEQLNAPVYREVMYVSGMYVTTDDVIDALNGTKITNAHTTTGQEVYLGMNNNNDEIYYCITDEPVVKSFPIKISALAHPNTQAPIGYHVTITSNDIYESVDSVGNTKMVNDGEQVYSKFFDINTPLTTELLPGDVNLENNVDYTLTVIVSLDSGLTATSTEDFTVAWSNEIEYEPNAEIIFDEKALVTHVRPYCEDENGTPFEGVILSLYRREFDGRFTEIASNINNTSNTFVTDPHPSLDYARYRVVAMVESTGAISYGDIDSFPIQEKAVIIQWDEDWSTFNKVSDDETEQPPWSGSMLRLPYNIDISDSHEPDVSMIRYIGREHPVAYYGTQRGETATWNVEIDKDDIETLYAIRRLSIWMGDVYVREPSGSGYWANITVSFNKTHGELTIPISFSITRVEGGI